MGRAPHGPHGVHRAGRGAELAARVAELEGKFIDHDERIAAVFEAIRQLLLPPDPPATPPDRIGFARNPEWGATT